MTPPPIAPPPHILRAATTLGFAIEGWDATLGGVRGHDQYFVGTHEAISAYLTAWATCRALQIEELDRDLIARSAATGS